MYKTLYFGSLNFYKQLYKFVKKKGSEDGITIPKLADRFNK